jgi:hypothetical protein
MLAAKSQLGFYREKKHNRPKIRLANAKMYLLNQAEIFLDSVPKQQWIPVAMIPDNIRMEVIELLIQGTIIFRDSCNYNHMKVIENEDFSAFKLEFGVGILRSEGFGI